MVPLDRLSALVLIAQAKPDDLVRIALPAPFQVDAELGAYFGGGPDHPPRVSCMRHATLLFARANNPTLRKDDSLDVFAEVIARDKMEEAARSGTLRVFDVRGTSTGTWHECRHCRWENRLHAQ